MRGLSHLLSLFALLVLALVARADDPLFLQPPYDEIVLDESNGRAVLRVQPAAFPDRRMPSQSERKEDLEFELIDRPGERFAVPWVNVADIRFFEKLVLNEVDAKVKEGRFDEALPYFLYLESKHPNTSGLKDSIESFLYMQVGAAFRAQRHEEALALLVELYGRNPARAGAATAYERVTAELVKGHMAAGRYGAARGLLRNLGERYPATKTTTVATYESQLTEQAQSQLAQATAAKGANKPREAHEAVQKAIALWPTLAGASELAQSLHKDYPVINVGVLSPLAGPPSQRLDDWAAVRTSRLLAQPIVEPNSDGAAFRSPLGEFARGEDSRQLTLQLKDDMQWATPQRKLTGHDVARCLLAAADPKHGQYDPLWAGILGGVNVRGAEVHIDLLRSQPIPEAWLVRPLWWEGGPPTCGPYQLESQAGDLARFVRQSGYFASAGIQAAEIVERTYPDSTAALRALGRGEISLIDRLCPWDVPGAASGGVTVHRYAAPTVHVLIPNPTKPLVANRTMRRALLYGIDRQGILRRGLVGGQELAGCELTSGPMPRGAASERVAYGYDPKIEPRPYEPGTGLLLAQLAIDETLGAGKTVPPLVLAFPAEPVARAACQSIARQLKLLNLQVTLRETKPGEPAGDFDLQYAEIVVREPAVDAWRVLGPGGIAGSCSSAMLLALRAVEAAPNKQEAAAKLQAVHRLAAAELPVIPLWQLAEHFAVHASVQGVSERPRSLYEGVEKWQAELRVPE